MRNVKVISGATAGAELQVEGEVVIGRESADLVLPDAEVSRRHAVLRAVDAGVEVEDLGSRNGTFVDGERLEQAKTVGQNASLRVGTTELQLEVELVIAQPDVTVQREIPQPDVTVQSEIPQPDVTAPRAIPQPDVTVQREVPQPDVTAPRAIPQPDLTVKREAIPQPDVTVKRETIPQPGAQSPQVPAAAAQEAAEPKRPQSPRELLPIILGGLAAAIAVAVILALLLG